MVVLYLESYCCSVAKSCPTLCSPIDCSRLGVLVLHYLLELLIFMFIESVMLSNHLILCPSPLLLESKWSYFGLLGWPSNTRACVAPPSVAKRWSSDVPRWISWVFLPWMKTDTSWLFWYLWARIGDSGALKEWASQPRLSLFHQFHFMSTAKQECQTLQGRRMLPQAPNFWCGSQSTQELPEESGSLDVVRGTPVQS